MAKDRKSNVILLVILFVLVWLFGFVISENQLKAESGLYIYSLSIDKVNALGKYDEEVRSFGIAFTERVSDFKIMIYEQPYTTEPYITIPVNGGLSAYYISPASGT